VRNCFSGIEIIGHGKYARIKPGTIISAANRALASYNRVLGPDPASSGVATVGGVVANNASGMTAGTKLNSYHTVASMKVPLPSGTLIDTDSEGRGNRVRECDQGRQIPSDCEWCARRPGTGPPGPGNIGSFKKVPSSELNCGAWHSR
jgi:FAD/FMN-containing dehydrogenase